MEDWFVGETYDEMTVDVTLSAVETVAIVGFVTSEQSFLCWEQIIFNWKSTDFRHGDNPGRQKVLLVVSWFTCGYRNLIHVSI